MIEIHRRYTKVKETNFAKAWTKSSKCGNKKTFSHVGLVKTFSAKNIHSLAI